MIMASGSASGTLSDNVELKWPKLFQAFSGPAATVESHSSND